MNTLPINRRYWLAIATVVAVWPVLAHSAPSRENAQVIQQPSALKKLTLDELFKVQITSVSQKSQSVLAAPAAVHVVTQDDIQHMGALSIPEALRNIPGVEVARVDSRQYAITARGFNGTTANKLLVMIDGRSVYTPLYSGVFWDAQDAFIEDIEQIEVIRGPGATIWGANAVNGVINIISKDAAQTQGMLLLGRGGNAEEGLAGARYGGTIGSRAFFRLYGKHFDRDAVLRPDGQKAGDAFRNSQGGIRIDWEPSTSDKLTLQGDSYGGSARQPNADPVELSGANGMVQWTRRFAVKSDVQLRAYYDRTDREIGPIFGETLDTYDLTLRHRFGGGRHDVVWGAGYRLTQDDVRNGPMLAFLPAHLTRHLATCFIQDELALSEDRLHLTVGSKVEHNDYTGFEYQPSMRLACIPTASQTIWGAASRAVRAPSRIDRDLFVPSQPPYLLVGDAGFDSEVLWAYELGYRVQRGATLNASLATFYNDYDKLRSLEAGPPAHLANTLEGYGYGFEAEATVQVTRWWRLNPGYTFLRLELDRTAHSTDISQEQQERDSPRHQFFIRSALSLPLETTADIVVRYVGELPNQQVPAYTTADTRLAWQTATGVEVALVGQSLLDTSHAEFGRPSGRREVRRSLYGKVTCPF
jgi:iron complex outermembrane recepter protein